MQSTKTVLHESNCRGYEGNARQQRHVSFLLALGCDVSVQCHVLVVVDVVVWICSTRAARSMSIWIRPIRPDHPSGEKEVGEVRKHCVLRAMDDTGQKEVQKRPRRGAKRGAKET